MSYFRASTANSLGWRSATGTLGNIRHSGPDWKDVAAQHDAAIRAGNHARSMRQRAAAHHASAIDRAARGDRSRVRMPRLSGLGDPGWNCDMSSGACSPCDTNSDPNCVASADQAQATTDQINQVSQYFQSANAEQMRQEQQITAGNQSGIQWPASLVQQIVKNRADLESLLDKYNTIYRASFGQQPSIPGLQGLGLVPLIAAGVITAIAAAIIIIIRNQANTAAQMQVQQQQAQTQGTLTNQLAPLQQKIADAQTRGDSAQVAQLTAQYNALLKLISNNNPNPNDWGSFFQHNWGWFAAALGGIVLVSRI